MSVTVQASKHPLKPDWVYADVAANQSIYEISGGAPVVAYINGREVPEQLHRLTKVKDNAHVTLWPVPQSDDVIRTVGVIAVAIVAPMVAPALVPAGMSATATALATGAVTAGLTLAGTLAINALIPPQTPDFDTNAPESFNRLESITGSSNRVASFKPIPRLYGTFQFFPPIPMTARPFTEVVGSDQYFRMLLCLGYGPLEIGGVTVGKGYSKATQATNFSGSPIRIGETDINLFEDVEYEIGTPDQMTLYTDQVIEINPAFSSGFNNPDELSPVRESFFFEFGNMGFDSFFKDENVFAIRTTEPDADEISIDIAASLFSVDDKAKTKKAAIIFDIEYREVGDTEWIIAKKDFKVESAKKETVREGFRWAVPTGQYEVKLTRKKTLHNAKTSISNQASWTSLRTIRTRQPFKVEDTVVMSLRIKATDQLNGRIENLSVLATSVLPVYDGNSWTTEASNNPAWVYADIWTGNANRRPLALSELDADALKDWADYCDEEGLSYNNVFDSSGTTLNRAGEVAGAGLASWQFNPDSKISVVRDVSQTLPKMVISPRNSFGFNYELSSVQVPEGLRVQFVDDRTWENTERLVFDDGFDESNATTYETIQAKGVTNPDQAWKYGRYHIAQQRLRPERYTFNQDVQHLRYQRGDLLTLQQDVISVGLGAGRVREVTLNNEGLVSQIKTDEIFEESTSVSNYGIKIQRSDGTISNTAVTPIGGFPTNELQLTTPTFDVEPDDLIVFGEAGRESIDVKVTEIQPQGDFAAQITCVPAAPEIEQAWDAEIPPFDPVLTENVSPDRTALQTPLITRIASDENALYVSEDGSLVVRLLVEYLTQSFDGWDVLFQVRYRAEGDETWILTDSTRESSVSIFDVDVGIEYEVQVRAVGRFGRVSPWTESRYHTVVGKALPPPDVQDFQAYQNGESVVFRWQEITTTPDVEGYEVRYGPRTKATWNNSIKIAETTKTNVVTEADVPPGDFRFFVKAIDTAGNYSEAAAQKDLVVKTEFELLEQTTHDPNWSDTGYFVGFENQNGTLVATNNEEAYFVADEVDLGFDAQNVRVWAQVDASLEIYDDVDDYGSVLAATSSIEDYQSITASATETEDYGELATSLPVSDPQILYQISYRNTGETYSGFDSSENYGTVAASTTLNEDYGLITDPVDSFESYDTLAQWETWTRGEVDARYVKQRIKIKRRADEVGLKTLRGFKTTVDAPERTERQQGLTVSPGGTTFTFNRPFHLRPTVTGTVETDQDLFPIRKSLDTNSVTFVVRDSQGNDVGADNFDLIAIGA